MPKFRRYFNPNLMISLAFLSIILLGTLLLLLPAASRSHTSCGFLTALFTATSTTCVTGLSLVDTYTQWSGFGQIVILCLIQIGGLGFMSVASILIFLFRGRVGLSGQMLMAQSLGASGMKDIVQLQKWMLRACLAVESAGTLLLTFRFLPVYGFVRAVRLGLFHAVSAFCNAGFDLFGFLEPGSSVMHFQHDPWVLLTLSVLIILGSLGFLVWDEVLKVRRWRKLSVYTKLVLIMTFVLTVGGCLLIYLCEYDNALTLGAMSGPDKWLNAFFQSVTLRTAGFAGISQKNLTECGKAFSMILMLIGGSSGSTAGGLKTVTMMVILLFLWSRMRGKTVVTVFHRSIPAGLVLNALSIFGLMISLAFLGAMVITATSPVSLTEAAYESVSAIATVGLSCDVTSRMSVPAKLLIILYMYFGRVGVLTISLGFLHPHAAEPRYRYADTSLLIG